jgi:hypothetical protein
LGILAFGQLQGTGEAAPGLQLPWPTGVQHRINGGYTYGCGTHTGSNYYAIDFQFANHELVSSTANGTVTIRSVGYNGGAGNYVAVSHGSGYVSRYLHLQDYWPSGVYVGAPVGQGQTVGYAGMSGMASGPHLHFDLKLNGSASKAEPMSGVSGFGRYGYSAESGYGCSTNVVSPYWTSTPHVPYQSYLLQTGTGLHKTGSTWEFGVGDYNLGGKQDVIGINKRGSNGYTTLHVLSGESTFQNFALHTNTKFGHTDASWQFEFGDWTGDGRPGLFGIRKSGSGTGKTEVHIYSAASNYQSAQLLTATALHTTNSDWHFVVADWNRGGKPDLIGVNRQGGSGTTEVHILSGESNFQSFILHAATILHTTNFNYTFEAGDYNNNGIPDLFVIRMAGSGTGKTEVHVLSGANNFQSWLLHVATILHETDSTYWAFGVAHWDGDRAVDVFVIRKQGWSSTEVHVLGG